MVTSSSASASTTVSAPGKILLAGGYLVLESPNVGVVVAVDKRFYTTVAFSNNDSSANNESAANVLQILVMSPQFGQEWKYGFDKARCTLTADSQNTSTNPFVEKTLRVTLTYLSSAATPTTTATIAVAATPTPTVLQKSSLLTVTIQADNDFYSLVPHLHSRNLDRSLASVQKLPPFLPAASDESGHILKTGLGSSAALVTSLTGALYHAVLPPNVGGSEGSNNTPDTANDDKATTQLQTIIANLAQVCHCHAQGKVGSGFDVSSACHGSHVYQRFPASTLADLLKQLDDESTTTSNSTCTTDNNNKNDDSLLCKTVQSTWAGGVLEPVCVPAILQVLLADVSGGSESPSMARKVLQWKSQFESSDGTTGSSTTPIPHWDDLKQVNQRIAELLQQVGKCTVTSSQQQVLASTKADTWKNESDGDAASLLYQLHQACLESRRHLKAMGDAAGVPIEPDAQTALADATLELPGVVAALVPGAGGYDAVACVYINTESVRQAIGQLWAEWPEAQVCPLTIQGADYGQGIRVESQPPN